METKNKLIVFQGKNIRRTWYNDDGGLGYKHQKMVKLYQKQMLNY